MDRTHGLDCYRFNLFQFKEYYSELFHVKLCLLEFDIVNVKSLVVNVWEDSRACGGRTQITTSKGIRLNTQCEIITLLFSN